MCPVLEFPALFESQPMREEGGKDVADIRRFVCGL